MGVDIRFLNSCVASSSLSSTDWNGMSNRLSLEYSKVLVVVIALVEGLHA